MVFSLKNIRFPATIQQPGSQRLFPGWLFFFRINIAGFALLHFLSIQPDFADLYSRQGYVYPDILDASYDHLTPTFYSLQAFLQQIHLPVSYEALLAFSRVAYPLLLVLLIVGAGTRVSAILSLFFQLLFCKSIHLYQYGVDNFTTIGLFYCCVFPVGSIYSLDNLLRKRPSLAPHHILYLRLLKAHLGIVYFFSGFDKALGPTWPNGEAMWKALHAHNYYSIVNLDFIPQSWFFVGASWATIVLELGYPVCMNLSHVRKYWLAGILLMHLGIALFLGLFFFSALMILLNLAAYYAPYIDPDKWAISSLAQSKKQ
jgi:Vitamin K-dependent gamma-carboxylase